MADLSKLELRDAVYMLFSKGNLPHSDKVKALVPKAGARNLYHHTWKQSGKPEHYEKGVVEASEGVVTGFAGVLTEPTGEIEEPHQDEVEQDETEQVEVEQAEAHQNESEQEQAEEQEQEQPKGEKGMEPSPGGSDESEAFAEMKVSGDTLPFKVNINPKTVALYQIAATEAKDGLTLGRFFDICAQDYFVGRGVDLGLVEIGGKRG